MITETTGIEKNTRQAANSLASLQLQATNAQKAIGTLSRLAGAAGLGALALGAIKTADAYAVMSNELRSATNSAEELHTVQLALIQQATEQHASLQTTFESYDRMRDATESLGLSQQEVIDLTATLSQTMRLSGQSTEAAQASVIRFATVLESGTLTLREFKGMLKESPELVKALADGLGVSVKELRLMAEQGKLTSDVLVDALGKSADQVKAKVAQLPPTLASAFQSLKSSFTGMLGEMNQGVGATSALAELIQSIADRLAGFAQSARLYGLSLKNVLMTIAIEIVHAFKQALEMLKIFAGDVSKLIINIAFLGQVSTEEIDRVQQEAFEKMRANNEEREMVLKQMRAEIDEAVDAANQRTDLTRGGPVTPTFTAEQIKAMESFGDALNSIQDKTFDAETALRALRIEMSKGKETADAFRAQAEAAAQVRELEQQFAKALAQQNIAITPEHVNAISIFVGLQSQQTIELKKTAQAWGVLDAAMNGAMSDQEKAAKQTAELVRAWEQMNKQTKPTADQVRLFGAALLQIQENANKAPEAFRKSMEELERQTEEARIEMEALNVEIREGIAAADLFRSQAQASAASRAQIEAERERFRQAGMPEAFGPDEERRITDANNKLAENRRIALETADAWNLVNNALRGSMSHVDAAEAEITELSAAMATLAANGQLSVEMRVAMESLFVEIRKGADMTTQALVEMGRTLVDGFINFLADGEFDMRRFASTMVQQIGRVIIQLMIMKALQGTKFGNFIGIPAKASGGVFSHGALVPFAAGGVVGGPTFFPMAGGQTGLMGEAGPEAVMPLARLSSGKLGVESTGPQKVEVINATGVNARARIERSADRTSIVLEAAELGAQMAEDRMTRSMRSGYGATSTALQRTYSLRRRG